MINVRNFKSKFIGVVLTGNLSYSTQVRNAVQGEILGQFEKPKVSQSAEKNSKESDKQSGGSAFQFSDDHQQTSEA